MNRVLQPLEERLKLVDPPPRASMRRSCPASGACGAASEARLPRPS